MKLQFQNISDNTDLNTYLNNDINIDVFSLTAKILENDIEFSNNNSVEVLYSDQILLPIKSLSLIHNVISKYNLSLNTSNKLIQNNCYIFKPNNSLHEFLENNQFTISNITNLQPTLITDLYTVTIGVYTSSFKIPSNEVLTELGTDCFVWYSISDLLDIRDSFTTETILIKFKYTVNIISFRNWIELNFKNVLNSLISKISGNISYQDNGLIFNLIIYPPCIVTGKVIKPIKIVKPSKTLVSKVLKEVVFKVSDSFANVCDRVYEITFTDNNNSSIIHNTNSVISSDNFLVNGIQIPEHFLNSSTSTQYSYKRTVVPITSSCLVTYIIPESLQKLLSNNLNYTIEIKETDLTSQRS